MTGLPLLQFFFWWWCTLSASCLALGERNRAADGDQAGPRRVDVRPEAGVLEVATETGPLLPQLAAALRRRRRGWRDRRYARAQLQRAASHRFRFPHQSRRRRHHHHKAQPHRRSLPHHLPRDHLMFTHNSCPSGSISACVCVCVWQREE